MSSESPAGVYKRHRFPAEVIVHCVWLYHRFGLSLRDVQEMMAERGVAVTYETIGQWCRKFGAAFAAALRRRRPRPGDKWHVDEVQLKMNGRRYWLWRAVDQEGIVLDILVQERRNQQAAETFFRRLVEGCGFRPRVLVTDKLASYPPAQRRVLPEVDHRRHKGLNNRAENSHRPTRRRERVMQRFKSPEQAQRFLSAFEPIRRPLLSPPAPSPCAALPTGAGSTVPDVATDHRLGCRLTGLDGSSDSGQERMCPPSHRLNLTMPECRTVQDGVDLLLQSPTFRLDRVEIDVFGIPWAIKEIPQVGTSFDDVGPRLHPGLEDAQEAKVEYLDTLDNGMRHSSIYFKRPHMSNTSNVD